MIEALITAGADPNERDVDGATPLHYAVIFNPEAPEAIEVLLDAGADSVAQNASDETPRDIAQANGWLHGRDAYGRL